MDTSFLRTLSAFFGRAAIVGLVLAVVWMAAYLLLGDAYCQLHGQLFDLDPHECAVFTYCGIGLLKLFVWVFFLAPWIAIQWTLKKS